jgi:hypothetical protein
MTTPPYPPPSYPPPPNQGPPYQGPPYQGPPYQGPPYQGPPYQGPPYGYGGPVPLPAAPGSVKGAFLIYLIAALLALIGIVLALTSDVWKNAIASGGVTTSGLSVESAVTIAKVTTVIVGVIFLGLYLLFAFKMRAGRNWARIVLTVLSGLSILSSFSASASVTVNGEVYKSSSTQASGVIGGILAVVAIVLMYLSSSNQYFAATKAARRR